MALGLVGLLAGLAACGGGSDEEAGGDGPRGAIVIMTDDQTLASLAEMPNTRRWLAEGGVEFDTAVSSLPLCCPARASLLTGQYAHNHGVTDNVPPDGGLQALDQASTLPVWLQEAGVATGHLGKYLNGYGQGVMPTVPPGWDHWYGLVDPTTYSYTGATAFDGEQVVDVPGYQTDALAAEATDMVEDLAAGDRPWFVSLAFTAPHVAQPETAAVLSLADLDGQVDVLMPPAPGFEDVVADLTLPQTDAVAETDLSDKPPYVQGNDLVIRGLVEQAGATEAFEELRDRFYRNYISSLLSVDEAVDQLMQSLDDQGALDDVLVVFTSDNGYHLGEHGLILRKATPYEESTRVPMLVRAPDLEAGTVVGTPVSLVDVTATVLDWLDVEPGLPSDGTSLLEEGAAGAAGDRIVPLESTQRGNGGAAPYHGVRTQDFAYVEYDDGVRELYDLHVDPSQLENRAADPAYASQVIQLSALARQLSTCAGEGCVLRQPIAEAAPGG